MWTGYMLRKDVMGHPSLLSVVQLHQIISVVIVNVEVQALNDDDGTKSKRGKNNQQRKPVKRKLIEVSCLPDAINNPSSYDLWNSIPNFIVRGQVLSIEDNGLLVQLGYGRRGFLSYDDIDGPYSIDEEDSDAKHEDEYHVDDPKHNQDGQDSGDVISDPNLSKKRIAVIAEDGNDPINDSIRVQ
jgi:hypothetical protein